MIPGPVSVDDEVLEALARPVRAHYGDAWTQLYKHAVAGMRQVFRTEGEVHLLFGPDSDARVNDADFRPRAPAVTMLPEVDSHRTIFRELDGIVRQVNQDLMQCAPVGFDHDLVRWQADLKAKLFRFGRRAQRRGDFLHHALANHRFEVQLHLARLDLGKVEQVVDEREQVSGAPLHRPELFLLFGVERRLAFRLRLPGGA